MDEPNEDRVPEAWVGREVVVRTLGSEEDVVGMVGKLEDAHEGGVVLSYSGPTPEVADLGPVLFYPWSAVEVLRLRVAPPVERQETREEPREEPGRDRAGTGGRPRGSAPLTEPKLVEVVPIAQQRSTAGVAVTLRSLEIYEDGQSLIGYLLSPGLEERGGGRRELPSFPEVRVRDDRGRSYEARTGYVMRASSGEVWLAGPLEADATELEVQFVRLFRGPPSVEGPGERVDGPWVFRFPLSRV